MIENKFIDLVSIVKRLRKECPWDKEQTHDSIKANTLEEAYEVAEAIDHKNYDELRIELGDLLLHVLFHADLAEDNGNFNLEQVIDAISEKLIRRHPHVFGDTQAHDATTVLKNWEQIKLDEGRKSIIAGVPKEMPALNRAYRIQEKASKVGFDWSNKEDVWKKVIEELEELKLEVEQNDLDKIEEEFGDLLFSLVNYSRFVKVNPEDALRKTIHKFIKRFEYVEDKILSQGKKLKDSNLEEMDKYWEESKKSK